MSEADDDGRAKERKTRKMRVEKVRRAMVGDEEELNKLFMVDGEEEVYIKAAIEGVGLKYSRERKFMHLNNKLINN